MFKFIAVTVGKTATGINSFRYRLRRVRHVGSILPKIGFIKDITGIVFVQNGAEEGMNILFSNVVNISLELKYLHF